MNVLKPLPQLFTTHSCPDSPRVRQWLNDQGFRFIERSLDDDPDAVRDLSATGRFVTPLLLFGDNVVVGYRPDRLSWILGLSTCADPD